MQGNFSQIFIMNQLNFILTIPFSVFLVTPVFAQPVYYPPSFQPSNSGTVVVPPTVINTSPPRTYMYNESKKSCRESEIDLFLFGIRKTSGDCTQ